MLKPHTICSTLLLLILCLTNARAQSDTAKTDKPDALTITASASGERVRFTASSTVVQIRLEIYNSTGKKMFDNEMRGGNVLDWHLEDGQAQRLADDAYLCVVTVKSLSGKITQEVGSVTIEKAYASLRPVDPTQMTAQQVQAVGPVEENSSLTIVKEDESRTTTVIAHNGEDGQITRGRGALSFRIGDFFSGKDTEQMRLTQEGNLGIGITNPLVRLDVDGVIRASQGIIFPDGTTQYSAASKTLGAKSTMPDQILGGKHKFQTESVTQNHIAKFTDGGGTLGDSVITETAGGLLGIGTPSPDSLLNIQGTIPSLLGHMSVIRTTGSNNGFGLLMDSTGSGNNNLGLAVGGSHKAAFSWDNSRNFLGFVNFNYSANDFSLRLNANGSLTFHDGASSAERFRITAGGNVGIGTLSPQQNLSVNGALNVDQAGLSNGALNPGITFGSMSGEGISSKRSAGGTGFGLDFYTSSINRISISNSGNVGIGTPSPGFKLDVADRMRVRQGGSGGAGIWFFQTTPNNDRAFVGMQNDTRVGLFGNSGAGWGLTMNTTTGDLSLSAALSVDAAGLNGGALYPGISFGNVLGATGEGIASRRSAGGNQFGLDFFTGFASRLSISNSGDVNIPGNLAANNLPGVRSNQVHCGDLSCVITVSPGGSYTADTIAVSVPAAGFLFISAFANISNLGNPFSDVEFNLFQCADINCNSSTLLASTDPKAAVSSANISWVIPVTGSGFVFLRTNGVSHNSNNDVHIFDHSLTAIYLPKGY